MPDLIDHFYALDVAEDRIRRRQSQIGRQNRALLDRMFEPAEAPLRTGPSESLRTPTFEGARFTEAPDPTAPVPGQELTPDFQARIEELVARAEAAELAGQKQKRLALEEELQKATDAVAPEIFAESEALVSETDDPQLTNLIRRARRFTAPNPRDLADAIERARLEGGSLNDYIVRRLPFVGGVAEAFSNFEIAGAVKRVESGTASRGDFERVGAFVAASERASERSIAGRVLDTATLLPAFGVEFLTTGGAFAFGRKAAERAALSASGRVIERLLSRRITSMGGFALGAALQTAANPQLIAEMATREMISEFGLAEDEAGAVRLVITSEAPDAVTAIERGAYNALVEMFTERTGGLLAKIPGVSQLAAVRAAIVRRFLKGSGKGVSGLSEIFTRAGFHGVSGEIFEERLGEVLRGEDFAAPDQIAVEALAFSIPGVTRIAADRIVQIRRVQREAQQAREQRDEEIKAEAVQTGEAGPRDQGPGSPGGQASEPGAQEQAGGAEPRSRATKRQQTVELLSPAGIARFVAEHPERAAAIAVKKTPSRQDVPEISSKRSRERFAQALEDELNRLATEEFDAQRESGAGTTPAQQVATREPAAQAESKPPPSDLGRYIKQANDDFLVTSAEERVKEALPDRVAERAKTLRQSAGDRAADAYLAEYERLRGEIDAETAAAMAEFDQGGAKPVVAAAGKATLSAAPSAEGGTQAPELSDQAATTEAAPEPTPLQKQAQAARGALDQALGELGALVQARPGAKLSADPALLRLAAKIVIRSIKAGVLTFPEVVENVARKIGTQRTIEAGSVLKIAWERARRANPGAQLKASGDVAAIAKGIKEAPQSVGPSIAREPTVAQVAAPSAELSDAERVQLEADQSPELRPLFSGMPVPARRTPLRDDVIPGPVQADREEVEHRLRAARGVQKPSLGRRIREIAIAAWHKATRAQEFLPQTAAFDSAREFFRLLQEVPRFIRDEVNRTVAAVIDPLGKDQLVLFERKEIVDNMLAALDRGEPLRFGFSSREEVEDYRDKLDDLVERTPPVKDAVERRRRVVREIVDELVARNLLNEDAVGNAETYFHQQVLSYVQAARAAGGVRRPGRVRRSFQHGRIKEIEALDEQFDYNTSYVESEASWMVDAKVEIEKDKLLKKLEELYDQAEALRREAKQRGITLEEVLREHPELQIWQPEPGNIFYRAYTISEQLAEALQRGALDELDLSTQQVREALAMGGPRRQLVLPVELVEQLNTLTKPKASGVIGDVAKGMQTGWKGWIIFKPKSVLGYLLRNMTGDIDAAVAGAPGIVRKVNEAVAELSKIYRGNLALPEQVRAARDLGVISSSMTARDIPSLKEVQIFKRFYESKTNLVRLPEKVARGYFNTVRDFNEFRENILRLAAFLWAREQMQKGTLTQYGGANRRTVERLKADMGVDVAAAHFARNLLGDYGNLTVFGNWMRAYAYPFWSWMEVNSKRWPRLLINAAESGQLRATGTAAAVAFSTAAILRLGWFYAAQWAWNNLMHPDEEEDLGKYDRQNPHLIQGRNPDGTVRLLRNVGALGDFLEWFGINDLVSLWPQYAAGQITVADLAREMGKSAPNRLVQGLRPDIKGAFEVLTGKSTFPDVFNPRTVTRLEAFAGIFGLVDEARLFRGLVLGDGSRPRPHYMQRALIGVSDPRRNALFEMYDLRDKYLRSKGKPSFNPAGVVSPFKPMREAVIAEDFDSFRAARLAYVRGGGDFKKFSAAAKRLDPIASRLNDEDEREFEQAFLTGVQRRRLRMARDFSQDMRSTMLIWWQDASEADDPPADRQRFTAQSDDELGRRAFAMLAPAKRRPGESGETFRRRFNANLAELREGMRDLRDLGVTPEKLRETLAREALRQQNAARKRQGLKPNMTRPAMSTKSGEPNAYAERLARLRRLGM